MSQFRVFYMRPSFFRDGCMGVEWLAERDLMPTLATLDATHVELRTVEAHNTEAAWLACQGEFWSPNGEARELIQSKGLAHTSMSVGDCLVDDKGRLHVCDRFGFMLC